jgi:hypothetical protein
MFISITNTQDSFIRKVKAECGGDAGVDELRTALFEYYEIIEAGFSLYVSRSP